MHVFSGLLEMRSQLGELSGAAVTIGNFDGVHRGHRELIRRTAEAARRLGVPSVVVTFEPHPLLVLRPELKLKRLFDSDDRIEQIERLGADILVIEPFSRDFSQLSPEAFLENMILVPFGARALVVGYDFSFGADRKGTIEVLRAWANKKNVEFEVVSPVSVEIAGHEVIASSSAVRKALESGEPQIAETILGRPYELRGIVKKGAGRGHSIGIPTANLDPSVLPVIRTGVYASWVRARGRRLRALVNVGRNPTFLDTETVHIEAHLPDWTSQDGDLYGERLAIEFFYRLRDEKKFGSVAELVSQIRSDIDRGCALLSSTVRSE